MDYRTGVVTLGEPLGPNQTLTAQFDRMSTEPGPAATGAFYSGFNLTTASQGSHPKTVTYVNGDTIHSWLVRTLWSGPNRANSLATS